MNLYIMAMSGPPNGLTLQGKMQLSAVIEAFPPYPTFDSHRNIDQRILGIFRSRDLIHQRTDAPYQAHQRLMQEYCPECKWYKGGAALFRRPIRSQWGLCGTHEEIYALAGVQPFVIPPTSSLVVDDPDIEPRSEREIRTSIRMQANVAQIGAILDYNIWIPTSDRSRVTEALPSQYHSKLITTLPLTYDTTTLKTIGNIDVLWLAPRSRSIAQAFEVEHTTAINSGLLRMGDLLALQPQIQISLHIVAPASRREKVRREIERPILSTLEGGAMAKYCSFLSYDAIEDILRHPNLQHVRATVLKEYEEFFDATIIGYTPSR